LPANGAVVGTAVQPPTSRITLGRTRERSRLSDIGAAVSTGVHKPATSSATLGPTRKRYHLPANGAAADTVRHKPAPSSDTLEHTRCNKPLNKYSMKWFIRESVTDAYYHLGDQGACMCV
jgi:hypothetical protein